MAGARNGRFFKWGLMALLFLTTVYMFYLYRNVKSVLLQRETTLDDMNTLHTRMTEELKGERESSLWERGAGEIEWVGQVCG